MKKRPYRDLKSYFLETFGKKVYKITIDAGLSCPNRDNGKPCIYCNERGSGTGLFSLGISIDEQLKRGIEGLKRKYGNIDAFIAYFQSYSNTYASTGRLKEIWSSVRNFREIVGISIGTRPDCIDREKLELMNEFSSDYKMFLELGLQSINQKTLDWIGRGHTLKEFSKAVELAKFFPFHVVAHIIIGFPEQNEREIVETALYLNNLKVDGVKIHLLYVAKGSLLEKVYNEGKFVPITKERYIDLVVLFLEHLHPDIVIHRVTGDAHKGELIAPQWSAEKASIIRIIEERLGSLKRG
ncbi:MAG: TIGR01212 family radical SAM protein [bacterium]